MQAFPLRHLILVCCTALLVGGCGPAVKPPADSKPPALAALPAAQPHQADQLIELGRQLFFDPRLSTNNQRACADCHQPQRAFSGSGASGWRDIPALLNLNLRTSLNWDGSANRLETHLPQHAADALVMAADPEVIRARLTLIPDYQQRFYHLFNSPTPNPGDVWTALASFVGSLRQAETPFDRYLKGDRQALSKAQQQGLELFSRKAGCIRCHHGPLASDEGFHVIAPPTPEHWSLNATQQIALRYRQRLKGLSDEEIHTTRSDLGRWYVSRNPVDLGAFRTPSLHGLSHTAPYMHNGSLATLEDVVEFYNSGGQDPAGRLSAQREQRSALLTPLQLTADEKAALVAFLHSMSAPPRAMAAPKLPDYRSLPAPAPRDSRPLREQLAPRPYLNPRAPTTVPKMDFRLPSPTTPGSLNPPNRVLSNDSPN